MTDNLFIDFMSLSQLVPGVDRMDSEKLASFFYQVARSFGVESIYRTFYVSNLSSHVRTDLSYE